MATYTNPTKDTSTIANPSLAAAGRTWDDAVETWDQNPNQWQDPFAPVLNPTKDSSTITNQTKN